MDPKGGVAVERWIGSYRLSDDRALLRRDAICTLVQGSYWGCRRTRKTIEASLEHSLCYGAYLGEEQVAFARVVTDRAVVFWLADVLVCPSHRGQGLGKGLVELVLDTPVLRGLTGLLATRDAPGLYARYGFVRDTEGRFMRRTSPEETPSP